MTLEINQYSSAFGPTGLPEYWLMLQLELFLTGYQYSENMFIMTLLLLVRPYVWAESTPHQMNEKKT